MHILSMTDMRKFIEIYKAVIPCLEFVFCHVGNHLEISSVQTRLKWLKFHIC